MTNLAFLPTHVHYPDSKDFKDAIQVANSNRYEAIYFDPKNLDNDKVFMLFETPNDFRILRTEYDSCLDRFHSSENDTLHVFETRSSAFRYLQKITKVQ